MNRMLPPGNRAHRAGLSFDTDEHVMDSLQRLQQPAYQAKFRVGAFTV